MTPYDGAMIGIVVAGMVWGALRGITWQLASIASLVIGYSLAHPVSGKIAPYLPGDPAMTRALSMLAAYALISGGIFGIAWMVRATLRTLKFEAYDRHLGMVLGGLEGALVGIVGTLFVVSLAPATREPIFQSKAGKFVGRVMDAAGPVLPEEMRKVLASSWTHLQDGSAPTSEPAPRVAAQRGDFDDDVPQPTKKSVAAKTKSSDKADPASEVGDALKDMLAKGKKKVTRAVSDAIDQELDQVTGSNTDEERTPRRRR